MLESLVFRDIETQHEGRRFDVVDVTFWKTLNPLFTVLGYRSEVFIGRLKGSCSDRTGLSATLVQKIY